jgi:GxxExxY protein
MVELDRRNRPVLGAAIEVHRILGPGLLESTYKGCLAHELAERGIPFRTEVPCSVVYKGLRLEVGYRLDFVIEERLIVELKSVATIDPIHVAQVMTYLRLTEYRQAFLLNFNVVAMRQGIRSYLKRMPDQKSMALHGLPR